MVIGPNKLLLLKVREANVEELKPLVVLVNGAPASGKSTLARWLAVELSLPLVAKDTIKEAMSDSLNSPTMSQKKDLGPMAYGAVYATVGLLLDTGIGSVVDCNFHKGKSERSLEALISRASAVVIHCDAPREVILRRYLDRATSAVRHPVHQDATALDTVAANLDRGIYAPLELSAPTLILDTTMDCQPNRTAVLDFVRRSGGADLRSAPII